MSLLLQAKKDGFIAAWLVLLESHTPKRAVPGSAATYPSSAPVASKEELAWLMPVSRSASTMPSPSLSVPEWVGSCQGAGAPIQARLALVSPAEAGVPTPPDGAR